ncbi:hypothetical protein U3516DRAFT_290531 [Neocallimastix sp. 'constans']
MFIINIKFESSTFHNLAFHNVAYFNILKINFKVLIMTILRKFFSDQYNITHINYNKSVNPIELSHFSGTAVECDK